VVRRYAQYCPVAKATEVLGDRWTPLILREMLIGATGFNELQRALPGISRSILRDRLRRLERAEVVDRKTGPTGRTLEYALTPAGRDLRPVVKALGDWGATWSFTEPRRDELDPDLLIVWIARHADPAELPGTRTVVQFDLRDPTRRYWMVLEPHDVSVCLQHPGFDVALKGRRRHRGTAPRVGRPHRAARDAGRRDASASRPHRSSRRSPAGSSGARSRPPSGRPRHAAARRDAAMHRCACASRAEAVAPRSTVRSAYARSAELPRLDQRPEGVQVELEPGVGGVDPASAAVTARTLPGVELTGGWASSSCR